MTFKEYISKNNITKDVTFIYINALLGEKVTDLEGIQEFTNLEKLKCIHNNVTELPSLDRLTNLKVLEICGNKLSAFPNLDKLTNLKILNCSDNNLTELPNLDKLTSLEVISCQSNNLPYQDYIESKYKLHQELKVDKVKFLNKKHFRRERLKKIEF